MSSAFSENLCAPESVFRSVTGARIRVTEESLGTSNKGVIKFVLDNETSLNVNFNLLLLCIAFVVWIIFESSILLVVSTIAFVIKCKCYLVSTNKGTLLIIESVGVHIADEKIFSGLDSCVFLPWDTIQDVFINEVINGQRVLYYLTFVVKESVDGRDVARLVPLFDDIVPERECLEYMYERYTNEFKHGKELMKIIRKIIKSQPRQGQQFGTRHLLVTYNHVSWTRQDKMFAMLKFQDRSEAVAYPCAFVLTVKIFRSLEKSLADTGRSISMCHDYDPADSEDKHGCTAFEYANEYSNNGKDAVESRIRRAASIGRTRSGNGDESNNLSQVAERCNGDVACPETKKCSTVSISSNVNIDIARNDASSINFALPASTDRYDKATRRTTMERAPAECQVREGEHDDEAAASVRRKVVNSDSNEYNDGGSKTNREVGELSSLDRFIFEKIPTERIAIQIQSEESHDRKAEPNDDAGIDSANLPYQYLIEKEIENARTVDTPRTGKTPASAEFRDKFEETKDSMQTKGNKVECWKFKGKDSERSSDITDLVMEGLMLTIRQDDDDIVSVVEQKTKLEIDEVLENSEKFETEEGEKCLLNASLLKLESLVTMIDSPDNKERDYLTKSTLRNISKAESDRPGAFETHPPYVSDDATSSSRDLDSASAANETDNVKSNEKDSTSRKVCEPKKSSETEEDEDIVPEALRERVEYEFDRIQSNNDSTYVDLLMDDMDDELTKCNTETTNDGSPGTESLTEHSSFSAPLKYTSSQSRRTHRSTSVPRIVSNKVVTIDQMPPALQRAIKRKLTGSINDSDVTNETIMESTPSTSSSYFEGRDESDNTREDNNDLAVVDDTTEAEGNGMYSYSTGRKTDSRANDDNDLVDNPDRSVILDKENNEIKDTSPVLPAFPPTKLQDITREFYQDLLLQQKKAARCIDRRSLRQRRRLFNTTDVRKDDEARIDMLKFVQHITGGAKVVVTRLAMDNVPSRSGKTLETCIHRIEHIG